MNRKDVAPGPLRYLAGVGMSLSGFLVALLRFTRHPIAAVLIVLGAMALFLYSAVNLLQNG